MPRFDTPHPDELRELDALDRALAGEPVDADLRDLEDLVLNIRATAPAMSPGFAARLEHEVAEGFPSPSGEPQRARRQWRWTLMPVAGALAAVLVAIVIVLPNLGSDDSGSTTQVARESTVPASGDSSGLDEESATPESTEPDTSGRAASSPKVARSPAPSPRPPQVSADQSANELSAPAATPPPPPPPAIKAQRRSSGGVTASRNPRKVERTALIVLEAPDGKVESTADAVIRTVDRFGGIVASSAIGSDAGGGEATFDLRIPTERLDDALGALSKLGHVAERSQNLQDITGSFTSAQDHLSDARAERRGLLKALGNASSQPRIVSLRARLRLVRSRIARLNGELNALRRRADLSTVSVTVRGGAAEDDEGTGGGTWTPGDAAADALRVLEVMAGVALIALAVGVPFALLGALIAYGARIARRRRREGALDAV